MGKQYIATANAGQAHDSDVVGVSVCHKYTVTVSSDGTAKFWDNHQVDAHNPKDYVVTKFINKTGIHHVELYENVLPDSATKIVIIAFSCFDGSVSLYYFINDDISTWTSINCDYFKSRSWAPGFYKDPESKQDYFLITQASGSTGVYYLNIKCGESDIDIDIQLEKFGELNANKSAFPNSLAICPTTDKKVAVGYTNGDVYIYDLQLLKPIYTFHSTDVVTSSKPSSSSIPRVLQFSPGGSLLAVARDNQSSGSITLYDVKYGENVGTLTTPSHSTKTSVGGFAHSGWIMGLSFDETGENLASCGFDKCVRVWNLETREREATITISVTDLEDTEHDEQFDKSIASGVTFIKKGIRSGTGGDKNEGLCVVSFDRGVRWYREAGGI
ncbi:WD40-repeat-containing domain protein [Scheffersomyces amazonensis]|uniref:WD40-repeat-containing domain protein n=1 Tax=Scheffersomyces amazonensis TaxID=1078765 RepID=UPI00315C9AE2